MSTRLSHHFKDRRLKQNLGLGQLARIIGYSDTGKGAGRIHRFEESGAVHADLLAKLTAALGIDWVIVEALIEEDRRQFFREWLAWATEPIRPYLVVRMVPAFYVTENLPDEAATLEEAEAFAAGRAKHWKKRCCLVWSRRHFVWFDEAGLVYERTEAVPGVPNTPHMRLGASRRSFLVRSIWSADMIRGVSWPTTPGPTEPQEDQWA